MHHTLMLESHLLIQQQGQAIWAAAQVEVHRSPHMSFTDACSPAAHHCTGCQHSWTPLHLESDQQFVTMQTEGIWLLSGQKSVSTSTILLYPGSSGAHGIKLQHGITTSTASAMLCMACTGSPNCSSCPTAQLTQKLIAQSAKP